MANSKKYKKTISIICIVISLIIFGLCIFPITRGFRKMTLKVGFVFSQSQNETFIENHIKEINKLKDNLSLKDKQIIIRQDATTDNCYEILRELKNGGCDIVFLTDNSLEDYALQCATENKSTQYCVLDSKTALTSPVKSIHGYTVAKSYSWYLEGVVSGLKLNLMIENGEISRDEARIGFITENKNTENVSAYSAFYLGAKHVCEDVKMGVKFIENTDERKTVRALIANGYRLIAQKDTAVSVLGECDSNNIYYIADRQYKRKDSSEFLLSEFRYDWAGCYSFAIKNHIDRGRIPQYWCEDRGKIDEEAYINISAFTDTGEYKNICKRIADTEKRLENKKEFIFDTGFWKVNNEKIRTTAGPELNDLYGGVEYIEKGIFKEYEITPYAKFNFDIDGISILD